MRIKILVLVITWVVSSGNAYGISSNRTTPFQKKFDQTNISRSDTQVNNWQAISSIQDVQKAYPNRLRKLLGALDLSNPGLSRVKRELQRQDTLAAADALLRYYSQKKSEDWPLPNEFVAKNVVSASRGIVHDTINVRNAPVFVPRRKDGGIKWNYLGPNKDDEFGYNLNEQMYFLTLLKAWQKTHNPDFASAFDRLIRDWTIHNLLPAKGDSIYVVLNTPTSILDWRDIGEVRWRTLEAGNRLGRVWPLVFYGFQQSDKFTPAARLLMLCSLYEHAQYIYTYHENHHNHALMELNGLAMVGLAFPEFKDADEWFSHAKKQMLDEMQYLIYPDGISKELTTSYHVVALDSFEKFWDLAHRSGKTLGASYMNTLEKMYNYLAYSMRPNGNQPLNNDSDLINRQDRVLQGAQKFNRTDWIWIATNGKKGEEPEQYSMDFPWAGIHIMRSGWDKDAQWAFFDTGPWGTAHQHSDKLHLSISAYGKDLLVDGGRYTYNDYFNFDPANWRGYFRSSFSHNVIIVDGKGENPGATAAKKVLKQGDDYIHRPNYDYARGQFSKGYKEVEGKVVHTRAILYRRGYYWIVVDRIQTDRPRDIKVFWHYGPSCTVEKEGNEVVSTDPGEGNLRIIPANDSNWKVNLVKGQTQPINQGWYSPEYGKKEPESVAVYESEIETSKTFAWILMPGKGKVPDIKISRLKTDQDKVKMVLQQQGMKAVQVTVPLIKNVVPDIIEQE
ncbi:MAG TPA: alginate lyase family protein [Balneolaceae bacterium]|nr:alginate lyase family protein [Balneolaceae bacterium]